MQTGVAATIGTGLVDQAAVDPAVVFGALAGSIIWNLAALRLGIPTSSVACARSAAWSARRWPRRARSALIADGVTLFLLFVLLSPLIGLVLGVALMVVARCTCSAGSPARSADRLFRRLQLVSSAVYSIGHGSNDAQKTVGVIWLLLLGAGTAAAARAARLGRASRAMPQWRCGTLFGGWRIVRTMGQRIVKLTPAGGFCAESAGAGAIHLASFLGVPISTTQTITASIVGVGIANRLSSVRWGVAGVILWAWLLTLPAAALLGAGAWYLGREMF